MKFEQAPQDQADKLRPYINKIITPLRGKDSAETAWITDEAIIGNFCNNFGSDKEYEEDIQKVCDIVGFEVKGLDFLIDVAKKWKLKKEAI